MEFCKDTYQKYLEQVKHDRYKLGSIPEMYHTDELLSTAVTYYGTALKFISPKKYTRKLITLSVQQNGYVLHYIDKKYHTEELLYIAQYSSPIYPFFTTNKLISAIYDVFQNSIKD